MILKNEVFILKFLFFKIVSILFYENIVWDVVFMKYFIGFIFLQFEVLYNFLDVVCFLEFIYYWIGKDCFIKDNVRIGFKSDFFLREKLFICFLRLKRGFIVKIFLVFFSILDRKIELLYVCKIFIIFIQLMYVIFWDM